MDPRRIAFYLPNLSGGGAERLALNLADIFLDRGIAVDVLLDRHEGELAGSVPRGVDVVGFGAARALNSARPLARYLKQRRPDVLISNLNHNDIVALGAKALAVAGGARSTKIITVIHNLLSGQHQDGVADRLLPSLYRLLLPLAHGIVCVSEGIKTDFSAITRTKPTRIAVIYNGVVTADFDQRAGAAIDHPWLQGTGGPVVLGVGRLAPQKDFATLIRSFRGVVDRLPAARLIILGEGPLRGDLQALTAALGLADAVDLPGYQANPLPFMRRASVVALSSVFEGFAIVLAEALACGTPVVSTDCPFGPAEILKEGRYGALVPVGDAAALGAALVQTLTDPPPSEHLRERGRAFSMSHCADRYLALIGSL